MAITKSKTYKGINIPEAYYKITSLTIIEDWTDEAWKLYKATANINSYTNNTKEYDIDQKTYVIKGLKENELTYKKIYSEVMKEEDFMWWVEV